MRVHSSSGSAATAATFSLRAFDLQAPAVVDRPMRLPAAIGSVVPIRYVKDGPLGLSRVVPDLGALVHAAGLRKRTYTPLQGEDPLALCLQPRAGCTLGSVPVNPAAVGTARPGAVTDLAGTPYIPAAPALEADIARMEAELGVETFGERFVLAMEVIDMPLMYAAALLEHPHPERLFGHAVWAGYLNARLLTRSYNGPLTPDFVLALHQAILSYTHPGKTTEVIGNLMLAGTWIDGDWLPVEVPEDQIEAIMANPRLQWVSSPEAIAMVKRHCTVDPRDRTASKEEVLATLATEHRRPRRNTGFIFYVASDRATRLQGLDEICAHWRRQTSRPGEYDPYELAARTQQDSVCLHLFGDYNGRVSRLEMQWILEQHGLHPSLLGDFNLDVLTESAHWTELVAIGSAVREATAKAMVELDDPIAVFGLERQRARFLRGGIPDELVPRLAVAVDERSFLDVNQCSRFMKFLRVTA
jgi:hypothetical protein